MAAQSASLVTSATMALARGSFAATSSSGRGAPAGDGDGRAGVRQRSRDGGADAAAAAGDQRVLAVQGPHHTFSAAGSVRTASRCS